MLRADPADPLPSTPTPIPTCICTRLQIQLHNPFPFFPERGRSKLHTSVTPSRVGQLVAKAERGFDASLSVI